MYVPKYYEMKDFKLIKYFMHQRLAKEIDTN